MLEIRMMLSQGPEESACFLSSIRTSRAVPAGAVLGACALTHTSLCDSIAFIACKCADRRDTACVLQMDPSVSRRYLQMIQSARNAEEQNLEAYMKNGHLVFRAIKDIPENTELLVWYGRDLAKLLGLSTEQKNTKGLICSECKQSFLFEFPLVAHKRFFCIKKPSSFLKKITIPEIHSRKPATNFHNLARELENCRKNRPTDAKSPKRRRSLESDTDESDGEPLSLDTHGDEKNWCAKCNISFHLTSDLVQHMRSHHKRALRDERQTRDRSERLKCPICNETFRERHHLSRHMTSHT
uniref:PR/SET domain 8a n=1 Tax=Cyprinus carpio carpio TaxID=630221 RepID=A0A9J7Y576_CYPCA